MARKGDCRAYVMQFSYEYASVAAQLAGNTLTEEQWRQDIVDRFANEVYQNGTFEYVFLIFHDRDPKRDKQTGEIEKTLDGLIVFKGVHAHVFAYRKNPCSRAAMMKSYGITRAENCIPASGVENRTYWALYFTHSHQKDRRAHKFEYDISDVIVLHPAHKEDAETWFRELRSGKLAEDGETTKSNREEWCSKQVELIGLGIETADDATRMLRTDPETINELELKNDSTYWMRGRRLFDAAAEEFKTECVEYYKRHNRCLQTVYYQAPGGTRKTDLARLRANNKLKAANSRLGYQIIAPKGGGNLTFDPAGNYKGEPITIANEFALSSMSLDMAKDMFDPLHVPIVNSRNTDKSWGPQHALLTTSNDLEEQIARVVLNFAQTQIKKGAEITGSGENGGMTTEDWEGLYLERPDMADQIRQVRRRFPIIVKIMPVDETMDAHGAPYVVRILMREDARNHCILHYGEALEKRVAQAVDGAVFRALGLQVSAVRAKWEALGKPQQFTVEVGAGLGHGTPVTIESRGSTLVIDPASASGKRPFRDDMRTDVFASGTNDPWAKGYDYGAFTTTHVLAYDPANDDDLQKVDDAIDDAFAMYYAINQLSVTPADVPLIPDLKAWRTAENQALLDAIRSATPTKDETESPSK